MLLFKIVLTLVLIGVAYGQACTSFWTSIYRRVPIRKSRTIQTIDAPTRAACVQECEAITPLLCMSHAYNRRKQQCRLSIYRWRLSKPTRVKKEICLGCDISWMAGENGYKLELPGGALRGKMSELDCKARCEEETEFHCASVNYHKRKQKCYLLKGSASDMPGVALARSRKFIYYDRALSCQDCSNNECLNGATCSPETLGYTCVCGNGYRGDYCEIVDQPKVVIRGDDGIGALQLFFNPVAVELYRDTGTGILVQDLIVYNPSPVEGFVTIGQQAQRNHGPFVGTITMAKDLLAGTANPAMTLPTEFSGPVWDDRGSGGDQDISFWTPVCPSGYSSVADIAVTRYTSPALHDTRCIRADLVLSCSTDGDPLWTDRWSGADRDGALWTIETPNGFSNFYLASLGYSPPHGGYAMCLRGERLIIRGNNQLPALEVFRNPSAVRIYTDVGTGANWDFSVYDPAELPAGFIQIGQQGQRNHGPFTGTITVVKDLDADTSDPALKLPVGIVGPIWNDRGSWGWHDIAFWYPDCPENYRPVSHVATPYYHRPGVTITRCVRGDLVEPCPANTLIWRDSGSGANQDGSVWELDSPIGVSNFFLAAGNHNSPGWGWCLLPFETIQ